MKISLIKCYVGLLAITLLGSCGTSKPATNFDDLVEAPAETGECQSAECAFTEAVKKAADDMGKFAPRLTSDSKTTDSLSADIVGNVRDNVEKGSELTYGDFAKFLEEHGRKLTLPEFLISLDNFEEGTIEHCLAKRVQNKLNSILGSARHNFVFEVKQTTADQQKSRQEFVDFLTDELMKELREGINAFFEYRKLEIAGEKVTDACEQISGVTGTTRTQTKPQTRSQTPSTFYSTRATNALNQGNLKEAKQYAEQAIEAAENPRVAYCVLSNIYEETYNALRKGKSTKADQAKDLWNKYKKLCASASNN